MDLSDCRQFGIDRLALLLQPSVNPFPLLLPQSTYQSWRQRAAVRVENFNRTVVA